MTLPDLLSRLAPAAEDGDALGRRLDELARQVRRFAGGHRRPFDAGTCLESAGQELVDATDDADEKARLNAALERLVASMPAGGRFLPHGELAPLHLLRLAARSRLGPARAALREELRSLVARADGLLDGPRTRRSDTAMGGLGSRFIDTDALTGVLHRPSAESSLPEPRRENLRGAFATLQLLADVRLPELIVVHDGRHGAPGLDELEAVTGEGECISCLVGHDDPCAGAAEIFDREAEKLAQILRAVRRIRLEAEGSFQPELHDFWLEQFDWQAFSRDELELLPGVVALVAADQVAGRSMASLSRLLLSGRPVQVVVLAEPWRNPGSEAGDTALTGFRFEPAYLGLSHREALVQQTSAARPVHMMRGFLRSLRATHASLHVIASGGDELRETAALEGRAHPLFHYDPEAGAGWAERLDFSHNPEPEDDWPVHDLAVRRHDGSEAILSLPFTFADFALLEPSIAHHFAVVPDGLADDELVAMASYCAQPPAEESARIPFVWGLDDARRLRRLAVSRPLALACRDRLDFWHTLQELAGIRSEYVRRAADDARRRAEEAAREKLQGLEASYAEELERVRDNATRDVVERLTSALLDVDPSTLVASAPAASAGAVAAPAVAVGGLAGRSVDEVTAALLEIVDPATLDGNGAGVAASDGERTARLASDLRRALAASEPF